MKDLKTNRNCSVLKFVFQHVASGISFYKLFYKYVGTDITGCMSKYVNGISKSLQKLGPEEAGPT